MSYCLSRRSGGGSGKGQVEEEKAVREKLWGAFTRVMKTH